MTLNTTQYAGIAPQVLSGRISSVIVLGLSLSPVQSYWL